MENLFGITYVTSPAKEQTNFLSHNRETKNVTYFLHIK